MSETIAQRRLGRIDVGVAHHEFFEDVVLDRAGELVLRHALFLGGDHVARQHRQHRAVHGHRHAISSSGMPSNSVFMSWTESIATPAMPTSPATRGLSEVVAAMGRQIERDREAFLAGREIAPVEGVGILRRGEAGILPDRPGLRDVHGGVGAAQERREAGIGVEEVEAGEIVRAVGRLHRDAFGREPGLVRRASCGGRAAHATVEKSTLGKILECRSPCLSRTCRATLLICHHIRCRLSGSLPTQCRFCRASEACSFATLSPTPALPLLQRRPRSAQPSAAAIWAPLARFIAGEERIGDWAQPPQGDRVRLRVRALRDQAGLGLPVRRRDGGADRRHLSLVSARRGAQPLRFHVPGRARDPGRDARFKLETLGGGQGHPHLSRRRHRSWKCSRPTSAPGSIRSRAFSASAACRCFPASCMPRSAATSRAAGGCSISASCTIRRCGRCYLLGLAIYVNFFAHHYTFDIRYLLFAAAALLFGRTWIYYKIWHVHRRMPLLLGLGLVVAVYLDRRESRHRHEDLALSAPDGRAGRRSRSASSARGSCC